MNSIDVHNADNISLRATKFGFADTKSYQDSVRMQCVAGNHANCDVLTSGTHQPCANVSHSGINCNGTQHNGADHCFNHNNSGQNGGSATGNNNCCGNYGTHNTHNGGNKGGNNSGNTSTNGNNHNGGC